LPIAILASARRVGLAAISASLLNKRLNIVEQNVDRIRLRPFGRDSAICLAIARRHAMFTTILNSIAKPIHKLVPLFRTRFTPWNLRTLDEAYFTMNDQHRRVHEHFIRSLSAFQDSTVLEIACGTGWNIPRFQEAGLKYFGLDISDTAIALAALKYPEQQYFNIAVGDCSVFRDEAFDVVYNSAMLEHIGYMEEAILEMVRLAKHQVIILFFEGLSDLPEHTIDFHRWDDKELSGEKTNIFGRKLLLQNHRVHNNLGWYWNRYSRSKLEKFLNDSGLSFELCVSSNCSALENQTALVISKTPASNQQLRSMHWHAATRSPAQHLSTIPDIRC
jgi:ubiquinone/menaquinone biosynthesis C-methylase UbiE